MHSPPSRSPRVRRRGLTLAVTALTSLGIASIAVPAATAATPAEIDAAVERGADYLAAQQSPNGMFLDFGGDWTLSSLAAAGRDVDAVRSTPEGPSALAAYRTLWTSGPDGEEDWTTPSGPDPFDPDRYASDYARAALIAHSVGLEPTRLSTDQNLVAQLAGVYHGRQADETPGAGRIEGTFGDTLPLSNAVSSLFVLSRSAAPQALLDTIADTVRSNQLVDGSWSWQRLSAPADPPGPDVDMTAQAIAALCDAGSRPSDPSVARGLAYLRSAQIANGSFAGEWTPDGDTNSAAVVALALNTCGIDPQGADWTTGAGNTPIDYLLSQQLTSGPDVGGFPASFAPGLGNLYASQEAVRALTGSGYVADPTRAIASPPVDDGTVVPQALAIDAGIDATGERDLRFCRVMAPVGATVAELLAAAQTSAQPSGCVTGLSVQDGVVQQLNGVTGDRAQRTWLARVEGGAVRRAGDQPVCHGQIVSLYVGRASTASSAPTTPCGAAGPVDPDPVDPATPGGAGGAQSPPPPSPAQPSAPAGGSSSVVGGAVTASGGNAAAPTPRVTIAGRKGAQRAVRLDRKGRLRITLRCPANAAKRGCWSVVSAQARFRTNPRGEARNRRVGGRTIRVAPGRSRTLTVPLSSALRHDLRRVGKRQVRIVVRTHGDDARKASRTTTPVTVRAAPRR